MNKIVARIEAMHTDSNGFKDDKQLEVIFSPEKKIIVEAPAGYGKTRTMISKIAYLIASNQVPNPKKILALTFSVNAAYKIKRDISEKLPEIFEDSNYSPLNLKRKIFASNYHGFCRRILQLYGYSIDPILKDIDTLTGIDDSEYHLRMLDLELDEDDIIEISSFSEKVKNCDVTYVETNYNAYLDKVKELFLPKRYIPFNAILLFTLKLFESINFLNFYKSYFPIIIIDEYQDTNILSHMILSKIIGEQTNLVIMGDPLQRIYGFIGAIQDIMSNSEIEYRMKKIILETNHRFQDNPAMMQLDKNIRENARNIRSPAIDYPAEIELMKSPYQHYETRTILNKTIDILNDNDIDKIAILVRGWRNNKNTDKLLETFEGSISYFNALFNDDDEEYIDFHQKAFKEFVNILKSSNGRFNNLISNRFLKLLKDHYAGTSLPVYNSLLTLLKSFLVLIFEEYNFLSSIEKIDFIKDTLENRALKQYLEYVDSRVIIATVHGAKGLEWEHVIITDMEEDSFPMWMSLCKLGKNSGFCNNCKINWSLTDESFEKSFYEELSVFYVAATRAKTQTIFTCSEKNAQNWSKDISCFLKMDGINYNLI